MPKPDKPPGKPDKPPGKPPKPPVEPPPVDPPSSGNLPELPRLQVDTTYIQPTGPKIRVNAGGDLQAALNQAPPGSTIELEAGATFEGRFILPPKEGAEYIYLQPADFSLNLPRIYSPSTEPAIQAPSGSHHWRLVGLKLAAPGNYVDTLCLLGNPAENQLSSQAHHIIVDRCELSGDPAQGGKRGVSLQGQFMAVVDSQLTDWKGGQDTQAIAGWAGAGPFKISGNFLEAAGENIMFGGQDAAIPNLTPADIEIFGNHLFKPLAWKTESWVVKNLLELKHASRVLIQNNKLENNWSGMGQAGFGVVFTGRNQQGTNPWATVADVTFRENELWNSDNGINLLGLDDLAPSTACKRLLVAGNLFRNIGTGSGIDGILFAILRGYEDITIDHNTALHSGSVIVADGAPSPRLKFINNIVQHNQYGIFGSNVGTGNPAITFYFPGSTVTANVFQSAEDLSSSYPPGNYFPPLLSDIGFLDYPRDVHLAPVSLYAKAGTDGKDIGYA